MRSSTRRRHVGVMAAVSVVVLVAASLAGCSASSPPSSAITALTGSPPRLLVLVVFDQMRGDYPQRWKALYGSEGFVRLQTEGAWFPNCHYPYAMTATGPGHASLTTGCSPNRHGIIGNNWYDRATSSEVYCAGADRYERVPPLPEGSPKSKHEGGGTPERLLVPTLADLLKQATNGQSKVVCLSLKDRSAVLPGGKSPDVVLYADSADGAVITSSYYRDALPGWVRGFNAQRPADQWFGIPWERLRGDLDYVRFSGPDNAPGEGIGFKQGVTFPHPMTGGETKPGKAFYDAVSCSPRGNELLLDLARRAVTSEGLGADAVADLLTISFSSNDLVGHTWGPDSQEVLDITLRSDLIVRDLLAFLDKQVGHGKYTLVLSSDHGICPLPESPGKRGGRLDGKTMMAAAEAHLRKTLGDPGERVRYIEWVSYPWVYLDHAVLEQRGASRDEAEITLAAWLATQPLVHAAYTRSQLSSGGPASDAVGQRMAKSFHPERAGDVGFVTKPYVLYGLSRTGTNHGSPHEYDTHVPLMVFGPGIKPGEHSEAVTPLLAAAVLARAVGLTPPETFEVTVPDGLFVEP